MNFRLDDTLDESNLMQPYPYNSATINILVSSISQPRFQPYLNNANGNTELGLRHYVWNAALASSLHSPLHVLEIALRNAVHDRMKLQYGGSWFDLSNILKVPELGIVADTKIYLKDRNEPVTADKIIAELSFRFWVGIFARKYDRLWLSTLQNIFSPRLKRDDLHMRLDRLRTLRNRIAHHEPILQRHLMADLADIKMLVESLSTEVLDWLNWHEQATVRFGTRIDQIDVF